MEKNYAYEIEKAIKERFKESKKEKEEISVDTKKNLLKLVNNCKNTKKEEYLYKFRYNILNRDITKPELTNVYGKLFKKILYTDENSIMFTEWNNIFSTVFANMPIIYDKVRLKYLDNIIDCLVKTNNENKIRCLMNLFVSIYHIDDKSIIDYILYEIKKVEEDYILDSYNVIIKNIYKIIDNPLLSKYFEYIFGQFSDSCSKQNSEYLIELLEILLKDENNVTNISLITLFKHFATSTNIESIYAYHTLLSCENFHKIDIKTQNECINLLSNISDGDYLKYNLITQIILNIIILTDNEKIKKYLIYKVKTIKNNDALELLLKLDPVLNLFTNDDEYIRVVNSLEDKSNNLTKKLVINLDCNE